MAKAVFLPDGGCARIKPDVSGMSIPVLCACGGAYDLGAVMVTGRYSDCSMWMAPCRRRECDDRPPGWRTGPSYQRLDEHGFPLMRQR